MALPPAGYSISKGAYFDADGQGPYAWDGANMRLLGSGGLGTFTWAALQAAYPNGGGALAALPAGVTAFVSDWGAQFTPNSAKTRWRPTGQICVQSLVTPVSNAVADGAQKAGTSAFYPAMLLEIGGRVWTIGTGKGDLNTNSKIYRIFLSNTTTVSSGLQPSPGVTHNSAANAPVVFFSGATLSALSPITFTGDLNYTAANVGVASIANVSGSNADTGGAYLNTTLQLNAGGVLMSIDVQQWYYSPPMGAVV